MDNIGLYISAVSALAAVIALRLSLKGSKRTDDRDKVDSASQLTRMETTLETVRGGIDDIRGDMKSQQRQIFDVSERLARMEESAKSTEKRIDVIEKGMSNEC